MSQRTVGSESMGDRHRAIRVWLAGELERLRLGADAGWRAAGIPQEGGDAAGAAPMLPVPELVARLEAGACVDGCALIDAEVSDDGCVLADEPETWEVAQ